MCILFYILLQHKHPLIEKKLKGNKTREKLMRIPYTWNKKENEQHHPSHIK
uniref:Uncharacterized protein n=1 Tax=Meloidogyne enterolobii TaxID=390850 RepID=A0A6V7W690_MELEN|nr:unnamed protein product [Meloidogyne enterolobii]